MLPAVRPLVSKLALAALLVTRLAAQDTVESAAPRDPDLTLADEPVVRIGIVDGPVEYIFGDVTGAVRLEDGSIVVVDEQSRNIRKYDENGRSSTLAGTGYCYASATNSMYRPWPSTS